MGTSAPTHRKEPDAIPKMAGGREGRPYGTDWRYVLNGGPVWDRPLLPFFFLPTCSPVLHSKMWNVCGQKWKICLSRFACGKRQNFSTVPVDALSLAALRPEPLFHIFFAY